MSDIAVRVENLGKKYRLNHQAAHGARKYTALRDVLAESVTAPFRALWRGNSQVANKNRDSATSEDFWALNGVSFEIKKGESVGIIGRNGAGKSTVLKILSRITDPTTGRIEIDGRVASLLEVGTGFHPELTGRENIYLNGAILGMTRLEVKRKFDEIVAFAEVEKFLDTPVKHFSSGMYVRLAFAVAAHLESQLLVVDEVLAVGDAQFQQKCLQKMEGLSQVAGRTVIFVSHNMAAFRSLCTRGIVLERGRVVYDGASDGTVQAYLKLWNATLSHAEFANMPRRGNGQARFTSFRVTDKDGRPISVASSGQTIRLVFGYENRSGRVLNRVNVGFGVHALYGERLSVFYSGHENCLFTFPPGIGEVACTVQRLPMNPGRYSIYPRIEVGEEEADFPQMAIGFIEVIAGDFYGTGRVVTDRGECSFLLDATWERSVTVPN